MTNSSIPVAIVGWGHSPFGKLADETFESLVVGVARQAIEQAGIAAADIDAMWLAHFNGGMVPDAFASSLILNAHPDLRFKPATRVENACASGSAAIYAAIDAIASGRIDTALVVGAEKMTGVSGAEVTKALSGATYQPTEAGLSFPAVFARFATAYADRFGDPTGAMARIAVKNHHNAMRNPLAHMRKELDLDFCLQPSERNPLVAPPLKVTDCSMVSDGAAAIILTRRELSKGMRHAVGFRAAVQLSDVLPLASRDLAAFDGPRRAFARAFADAGINVHDLSFAEVHDCFTIAELITMEAMGLAEPGGGSALVRDGHTTREGRLPINISGGLKAKGHPVGATGVSMHVLAARQLCNVAGDMQVADARLGLTFNMGGGAVASYVSILEPLA